MREQPFFRYMETHVALFIALKKSRRFIYKGNSI